MSHRRRVSVERIVGHYKKIFQEWKHDDTTINHLFGFPTPSGKFCIDVSLGITEIFGDFLSVLEMEQKSIIDQLKSKDTKNIVISGVGNMSRRYAIVFFPARFFHENRDQYLYGVCSGQVDNPLGYYFKWLQFEGEDQLDDKIYYNKDWKIVWIPNKLSGSQIRYLGANLCLPTYTGRIRKGT